MTTAPVFIRYRVFGADGKPLESWTRLAWSDFAKDNPDDAVFVLAALASSGVAVLGGGAQPIWEIRNGETT
jgi:hypothetical protein